MRTPCVPQEFQERNDPAQKQPVVSMKPEEMELLFRVHTLEKEDAMNKDGNPMTRNTDLQDLHRSLWNDPLFPSYLLNKQSRIWSKLVIYSATAHRVLYLCFVEVFVII